MGQSDSKISFERLSVYRDAFEEIIKLSNVFSPLLQPIKVNSAEMFTMHVNTLTHGVCAAWIHTSVTCNMHILVST